MNPKTLLTQETDRGVSPVIGVILMVAITVILAAVIGAFVLGLGDQVSNNAPQASFEFDFNGTTDVDITHGGGDDIDAETIKVTIAGTEVYPEDPDNKIDNTPDWGDTISTGSVLTLENSSGAIASGGDTVRVVWQNPSGGSSNTIGERDWPT